MVLAIEFVKPEVTVLEIGISPGQLIIIVKGEEELFPARPAESAYPSTDSIATAELRDKLQSQFGNRY
jgi:hypothetical protein